MHDAVRSPGQPVGCKVKAVKPGLQRGRVSARRDLADRGPRDLDRPLEGRKLQRR